MTATLAAPGLTQAAAANPDSLAGVWPGLVLAESVGEGWRPAAALADPRSSVLDDLLTATARRYRVPPHAAAALVFKTYGYWVSLPVTLGWAFERRIPLVDLDRVAVRVTDGPPYVTVGVTRLDVVPTAGFAGLRATLVERHLAPVAAALQDRTRVGERPLWGSLAEALAYPLLALGPALPRDAREEAATLLAGVGAPVEGLVEFAGDGEDGPLVRRRTCCLAFTSPDLGFCGTCCVSVRGTGLHRSGGRPVA